ncbi:MAG TPA: hypothetical protein VG168_06735, partial [Bryobacteraceae bacterium]|nr:hypothetical protein [Bryobacteraceae bacterium]
MLHFTNTDMFRSGMAINATPATSPSNTTASAGFSLNQFETELSALVNEALQAAGVSPSEASFSFNPTSSSNSSTAPSSSTTSSNTSTTASTATDTDAQSQTNAAAENSQPNAAADTSSTANSTSAMPLSLTDDTNPVVGTEGLIYDPKVAEFGGMGAAPITDTTMLQNPFTGQKVSEDLVFAGYQKIYGSDTTSLEGALMQQWGPTAVQDYVQKNPGTTVASIQQETAQNANQTNFELYGPWASFTDPSTGVLSYFDANGVQYADGTGPASQMFNALGGQNTAA